MTLAQSILALFILVSLDQAIAESSMSTIMETYVQKCGGKDYSKCDGQVEGLSQKTLFEEAEKAAVLENKNLVILMGSDWCAACRLIARDMKQDPKLETRINKHYVLVKLNNDLVSAKEVLKAIGMRIPGVPYIGIYDPKKKSIVAVFPALESNTEAMVADLEKRALGDYRAAKKKDLVRPEILNSPVKVPANLGSSTFTPSTGLAGESKDRFIALMRQGMLYYHSFHWINAYRSFNQAAKIERNPVTLVMLGLAGMQVLPNNSGQNVFLASEAVSNLDNNWVDQDDRQFVQFMAGNLAKAVASFCTSQSTADNVEIVVDLTAKHQFKKSDYLALLGWVGASTDLLRAALTMEPSHQGAHHYMIHFNETSNIKVASEHAEYFAKVTPEAAHAQHMWGHVLPQLGKWNEALQVFKNAHAIHLREFANEGYNGKEDWHYSHNLDLMVSTMIYLDKSIDAEKLMAAECTTETLSECFTDFNLKIVNGRFAEAQAMFKMFGAYENYPAILGAKIVLAIGLKDRAMVDKLVKSARDSGDFESEEMLYARAAYQLSYENAVEDTILEAIRIDLKKPGFDSWSSGVVSSRALMSVLRANGKGELADKIKSLTVSVFADRQCKTEICKTSLP